MPSQDEKQRRKQILDDLAKKQKEAFENNLPMSRDQFQKLFDFLDEELEDCDDTLKLTEAFLTQTGIVDKKRVLEWLNQNGGYCDCEVLANVEEQFN
jgi:hypothetical protein